MTCGYCDVKGYDFNGFIDSSESLEGYEDSVSIVKTINNIKKVKLVDDGSLLPNKYYQLVACEGLNFHPINYCPMCGRKLEDEK